MSYLQMFLTIIVKIATIVMYDPPYAIILLMLNIGNITEVHRTNDYFFLARGEPLILQEGDPRYNHNYLISQNKWI